jgi:hypothetical protein
MIAIPREKQCATVQKLGLNIRKLEEATMVSISNWFNDKEHPENAAKQVFLEEIFNVAKAEERYNNGEIGIIAAFCAIQSKDLTGLVDNMTCIPEIHSNKNRFDGSDIAESWWGNQRGRRSTRSHALSSHYPHARQSGLTNHHSAKSAPTA